MYGVINKEDLIDEECPHDAIKDQAQEKSNDEESPQVHEEPPQKKAMMRKVLKYMKNLLIFPLTIFKKILLVRVLKHPFLLHIRHGLGYL